MLRIARGRGFREGERAEKHGIGRAPTQTGRAGGRRSRERGTGSKMASSGQLGAVQAIVPPMER